jgi:ubiquitin-conjugating enzyme E2 Z
MEESEPSKTEAGAPPTTSATLSKTPPPATPGCLARLKGEVRDFYRDPLPGVCVVVDDKDFRNIRALLTGPEGTPYEGGFFSFKITVPYDYPSNPPHMELLTTDSGRVRFNPNLYANGKVCLSILNTWHGPSWSPAQSISSVLLSVQSIMNARPYCNEPGFENPRDPRAVEDYSECILHETIRVAFCDILEESPSAVSILAPEFLSLAKEVGPRFFEQHMDQCKRRLGNDNRPMNDPFGAQRGNFQWSTLLERLQKLVEKYGLPDSDEDEDEQEEEEEG